MIAHLDDTPRKDETQGELRLSLRALTIGAALLIVLAYGARHWYTLTHRVLMWDDFLLLSDSATVPRFAHCFLYTFLHFIPFLRLAMFAFIQLLPVHHLPAATSLWCLFWVVAFALSFLRLLRLYGIALLPALAGLSFVLFNPLFAEIEIWFTSTFYLIALVLGLEGLVQMEHYLRGGGRWRAIASGILFLLAPSAWSTGYIAAGLGALVIIGAWRTLSAPRRRGGLLLLAWAFLAYPALRFVGEFVAGSTYLSVTPWKIGSMIQATLKLVGDGLIFGSLGLWGMPARPFPRPPDVMLYLASGLVMLPIVAIARGKNWRLQAGLAFVAVFPALAVPLYFRGTQFSYDDMRWFVRYFTTPLFGGGMVLAIAGHMVLMRWRNGALWSFGLMALMITVGFLNKLPEHYVYAGLPRERQHNLRRPQMEQLRYLSRLFATAQAQHVGAQPLVDAYYAPLEGSVANHNAMGLYTGYNEPNAQPISAPVVQALNQIIRESEVWKSYQSLTYNFDLPTPLLRPGRPGEDMAGAINLGIETLMQTSPDIHLTQITASTAPAGEYLITGGDPYLSFRLPPEMPPIDRVVVDAEILGAEHMDLEFTLAGTDGSPTASLRVRGETTHFICDVPVGRFAWLYQGRHTILRLDPEAQLGASPLRLRLWRVAVVP